MFLLIFPPRPLWHVCHPILHIPSLLFPQGGPTESDAASFIPYEPVTPQSPKPASIEREAHLPHVPPSVSPRYPTPHQTPTGPPYPHQPPTGPPYRYPAHMLDPDTNRFTHRCWLKHARNGRFLTKHLRYTRNNRNIRKSQKRDGGSSSTNRGVRPARATPGFRRAFS